MDTEIKEPVSTLVETEKNALIWKSVEITLTGENGEIKKFTYQSPWKINAIKDFMWRIAKKQTAN